MEQLFWLLTAAVFYVYFGYPLLLWTLRSRKKNLSYEKDHYPAVTLVIAAHNEESLIEGKLENVLAVDYPKEKLQLVVASDASTDATNNIVRNYSAAGLELYEQKEHKGKSAALNYVVENTARGEIIIFNDASAILEMDAVRKIVSHFSDPSVGAAAGRLSFKSEADSAITQSHGLYWKYEEFLRNRESDIGYLPFVSGAFYAIRKNLYTTVPEHMPDDSVSPLGVYKQGYRVCYAKDAVAYETGAEDAGGEFRIKTRGVVRELSSIFYFKELLTPLKYPMLSLVLISHRLLRWAAPLMLIILFMLSLHLAGRPFYKILLWIQAVFYGLALCGFLTGKKVMILSMPFYYTLVNFAALWGLIKFFFGEKQATWKPVRP
ncbi:MAG: glycosyltransferase family 2 protein [Nitrospirae bacterium]|nr:glycosyltransferase family 2 protein [Nitrospirota bacterium]